MRLPLCALALGAVTMVPSARASAPLLASVPAGFTDGTFSSGLSSPTAMAFAPDGRLFVCQQNGALRVVATDGSLLATPFMTVSVTGTNERGLLGVTFDPNYASNRLLYVFYSHSNGTENRVSKFRADGANLNLRDTTFAEQVLLTIPMTSGYHNGGAIHFGPDGYLYVALGEGHTSSNAQSLTTYGGKMLRLNASDGSAATGNPTTFPGIGGSTSGQYTRLWAVGFRNPFTFGFHPSSGMMFVNDVGQGTWEEVNEGIAGRNYAWPNEEGFASPASANYTDPRHAYGHGSGTTVGNAITGGAFYPASGPFGSGYHNRWFFADFTSGWIRVLNPSDNTTALFATGVNGPVDLKVGADGALYYLARGAGAVGRVTANTAPNQPPVVNFTNPANNATVSGTVAVNAHAHDADVGTADGAGIQNVVFELRQGASVIATITENIVTYDWPLNTTLYANGVYTLRATATSTAAAGGTASTANITITINNGVPNTAPTATITTPTAGTTFNAGSTVTFSGTGTDAQDGTLTGAAFTWRVDFHHDAHTHPHLPDTTGSTSGSFVIGTVGETSANVWFRIHLTVTDTGGLTHSVYRDILPNVATLTVDTAPAGLQVTVDGQPQAAPISFQSVVGLTRTLGVVSPQSSGGTTYVFASWSDGGTASHTISTPGANTTYTVTYVSAGTSGLAFSQDPTGDQIVSVEGESASGNTSTATHSWLPETGVAGFSGAGALRAMPDDATNNNTGYAAASPRLDYAVNFAVAGTHYVWVRGAGPAGAGGDDSVHVGLDGAEIATSDRIAAFGTGFGWLASTLDGIVATIDVPSAGLHVVNVWMRESGFTIDKFLLTTNPAYVPAGTGPAGSALVPVSTGGGGGGGGGGGSDDDDSCGALGLEGFLLFGLLRRRRRP